jgi:hypothetical protein
LRCSRRSLVRSRAVRTGACSISPVDRATETATPRSMPTVWLLPGAGTGSGITAKAICQACGQPWVRGPRLGKLPALFQIARRACPARVPVGVLLDGQIPYVPGVSAVVPQHRLLGGRGEQPVPGHANILASTADISREVKRRFLPGLKAGVSTLRF